MISLFGDKLGRKYSLLAEGLDARHILSNTLTTNGLQVGVHAIDTRKKKVRSSTAHGGGILEGANSTRKKKSKSHGTSHVPTEPLSNEESEQISNSWFLGIDWGVRYAVGACAINGRSLYLISRHKDC